MSPRLQQHRLAHSHKALFSSSPGDDVAGSNPALTRSARVLNYQVCRVTGERSGHKLTEFNTPPPGK